MNFVRTSLIAGTALLLMGAAHDDTRDALPSSPPRMLKPPSGVYNWAATASPVAL